MSAILSADDLNDFISPGVACIKPIEVQKTNDSGKAEIEISTDGIPVEVSVDGQQSTLKPAQISLSDCLACSGCITSAESVLVSMQSHNEVLKSLQENPDKIFVASVSHQTRTSLAGAYGISITQVDAKLKHLFVEVLGFKYIVGLEIGRGIALEFGAQEVLRSKADARGKPILSSSCPGWTCYVEKTHPHMIEYLSHIKSPQQITGTLLKDLISRQLQISKDRIYHLSIMPCFDKKLEASRPEFGDEQYREVDCVITTKEIIQMLIDQSRSFEALPECYSINDSEIAPRNWPVDDQWKSHSGSSSGGYLHYVLNELTTNNEKQCKLNVTAGRNTDIIEYEVIENGNVIARAAQIYGFRNIQNLVRKLKPKSTAITKRRTGVGSSTWDYVEVMACPGGCINGGGQIGKPDDKSSKEWKDGMEKIYQDGFIQHKITKQRIQQWISSICSEDYSEFEKEKAEQLITASFKAVEKDELTTAPISIGTKW